MVTVSKTSITPQHDVGDYLGLHIRPVSVPNLGYGSGTTSVQLP